jgi:two-component sensor histidine kinase
MEHGPGVAGALPVAVLAIVGLAEALAAVRLWTLFRSGRKRDAQRLQAVAGGDSNRIFRSDRDGGSLAVLSTQGWKPTKADAWITAIHPEDRQLWPPKPGVTDPQLVALRVSVGQGAWRWHRLQVLPLRDEDGRVREWIGTLQDIHAERETAERQTIVIGELRHRLKNLFAVIEALAQYSRRRDEPGSAVDEFVQRFLGRLRALGTAGDLVLAANRPTLEAGELVRATLAPFIGENAERIRMEGPRIVLSEQVGGGLGLAVHELATNALKYGALSVPDGNVRLVWSVRPADGGEEIAFEWREHGGPRPEIPTRSGFGTRMIKAMVANEKQGRVEFDYPADGLVCRISFVRSATDEAPINP